MLLYYANEESDDVIGGSTKIVQHSIKHISRNIGAVLSKLGKGKVHHKTNRMTSFYYAVAMATLSALVSFCEKNKYLHLQSF